jgi:hypothetical protein
METSDNKQPTRSSVRTRLIALGTLLGFVSAVGYASHQGYRAATDSFVAPIILSPDSDIVLASKLKISELAIERTKTMAEAEAIDADLAACDAAIAKLGTLRASAANALAWTSSVTAEQARAGRAESAVLARQRAVLTEMIAKQTALTEEAKANLAAGLISKTDYAHDVQALHQMQLALLDNGKAQVQTNLALGHVALAQRSLGSAKDAPVMPEAIAREDQLVRIDLEIMKLESEKRSKLAEKRVVQEKLAKIEEIDGQLRSRPLYRATERSIEVAFVPYTQIEGVRDGADVYDCVLGLFACKRVGTVTELVPGEVVLPDPWGNQARGQYAVLDLREHDAAKSKTLRIRGGGAPAGAQPKRSEALSSVSR